MRDRRVAGGSAQVEGGASGRSGTGSGGRVQDVCRGDHEVDDPGAGDALAKVTKVPCEH